MRPSLKNAKIIPNVFSDHSALGLCLSPEAKQDQRGPGFWKFNNSLLTDKEYTKLISKNIPEFAPKYHEVTDKELLWEMIKMEIRATTILFSKKKAKENRDKERKLLETFNRLQEQIRSTFSEATKAEIDHVKSKHAKVFAKNPRNNRPKQSTMV